MPIQLCRFMRRRYAKAEMSSIDAGAHSHNHVVRVILEFTRVVVLTAQILVLGTFVPWKSLKIGGWTARWD